MKVELCMLLFNLCIHRMQDKVLKFTTEDLVMLKKNNSVA